MRMFVCRVICTLCLVYVWYAIVAAIQLSKNTHGAIDRMSIKIRLNELFLCIGYESRCRLVKSQATSAATHTVISLTPTA